MLSCLHTTGGRGDRRGVFVQVQGPLRTNDPPADSGRNGFAGIRPNDPVVWTRLTGATITRKAG
jgi:hypothetical protein